MKVKLLLQGYDSAKDISVGSILIKLLDDESFDNISIFSAFSSASAVRGLQPYFEKAKTNRVGFRIVIGIDQHGTSEEALYALLNLKVPVFIYYQPSKGIFHPKIYLFEGKEYSKLIVGSSNLTAQGLYVNTETSLLLEINNSTEDKALIQDLKDYFKGIFDEIDKNLQPLSKRLIQLLVEKGLVPSEKEQRKLFQKKDKNTSSSVNELLDLFPKRIKSSIPKHFLNTVNKTKQSSVTNQVFDTKSKALVWTSNPLTERDLNIPKGNNTNPTGSMLFKKGQNTDIDQRHFFRDVVFKTLDWKIDTKKNHLERAYATFTFYVNKKLIGKFLLRITHNTRTDSKAYLQNNSMTQVSWGEAKSIVSQNQFLGKTLYLYIDHENTDSYVFVIE